MRTTVRHTTAPTPNACRWCGIGEREHYNRWVPSVGGHLWAAPTPVQRKARMAARRRGVVAA